MGLAGEKGTGMCGGSSRVVPSATAAVVAPLVFSPIPSASDPLGENGGDVFASSPAVSFREGTSFTMTGPSFSCTSVPYGHGGGGGPHGLASSLPLFSFLLLWEEGGGGGGGGVDPSHHSTRVVVCCRLPPLLLFAWWWLWLFFWGVGESTVLRHPPSSSAFGVAR